MFALYQALGRVGAVLCPALSAASTSRPSTSNSRLDLRLGHHQRVMSHVVYGAAARSLAGWPDTTYALSMKALLAGCCCGMHTHKAAACIRMHALDLPGHKINCCAVKKATTEALHIFVKRAHCSVLSVSQLIAPMFWFNHIMQVH